MKTFDATLQAFLQSCINSGITELPYCELFTVTLGTGDILRYTDWDANIKVGGNTFFGTGLVIPKRGNTKIKVGVDVDEMQLDFLIGYNDDGTLPTVLRGMTLQMLASSGMLDKAEVLVQRLFWQVVGVLPPWSPVWKFSGSIAKPTEISAMLVSFEVQSHLQRLQRQVPNTIIEPGCPYQLFDARCGVSRAAFGVVCTVATGSNGVLLKASALTQADGWFDGGYLVFSSGLNQGLAASIKRYTLAYGIALDVPLLAAVSVGDQFTAYPGCGGTISDCTTKFSNGGRNNSFPNVPVPETAI